MTKVMISLYLAIHYNNIIIRQVNNKLLGRQANFEYSPSHSLDVSGLICSYFFKFNTKLAAN